MIKNNDGNTGNKRNKIGIILTILFSAITGYSAQWYCYYKGYIFFYRDAVYRLEKARGFFDSDNPGLFSHLGTVWLPVTHLLMAPLAYFDNLWHTGLAGSIIGYICFVLNALFMYLILREYIQNKYAIVAGLVVFVLNPNLLYFQSTALTEQPYLMFITASLYFLFRYSANNKDSLLVYSGLFMMLAMGTRYDGWAMLALSFVMLFFSVKQRTPIFKPLFYFSILPAGFAVFWFLHNWLQYGDPLEFARGKYSTLHQLKYYEDAGRLFTKSSFRYSWQVSALDTLLYVGLIFIVLTILGAIIYAVKNKFRARMFLPYIMLVPFPVMFLLLYMGQIIIEIPSSFQPGYFNSRYAIYILPGISFFIAYLVQYSITISKSFRVPVIAVTAFLILWQNYYFISDYPEHIPAIAEAEYCFDTTTRNYTYFMKMNYDGGKVLYDYSIFALSPETRINIRDRMTYYTSDIGRDAMKDPKKYAKWIMVYTKSETDSVYLNLRNNPKLLEDYNNVFSDGGVEIFKVR